MFSGLRSQFPILRQAWAESKPYRVLLVVALVYFVLRLGVHAYSLADPSSGQIGADQQTYLDGARHFLERQNLYNLVSFEDIEATFSYSPAFALAYVPFVMISPALNAVVQSILHLAAYALIYLFWGKIFQRMNQPRANRWLALTLPLWLVYAAFWGDMVYLNSYVIAALIATLFIDALLEEKLVWSAVWLAVLIQYKPHWAFAALLPLLLGRYRFFFRYVGLALVLVVASVAATMAAGGPAYVAAQYADYARFLTRLGTGFPWRGPEAGFIGYNHSVKQIVAFLFGANPTSLRLADGVKLFLLAPLALAALRQLFRPARLASRDAPVLSLDLACAFYLGAFLWLDWVWELSLGVPVFAYLLATHENRILKAVWWVVFLPYVLVDFFQLASYLAFGDAVFIQDAYVRTDPSIYVPLIMLTILAFYFPLVWRLWQAPRPNLLEMRGI